MTGLALTSPFVLVAALSAQSANTIDSHVGAAKTLAAANPTPLVGLCTPEAASRANPQPRRGGQPGRLGAARPRRSGRTRPIDVGARADAWYLQERFGARVLLTTREMVARNTQSWPKPRSAIRPA